MTVKELDCCISRIISGYLSSLNSHLLTSSACELTSVCLKQNLRNSASPDRLQRHHFFDWPVEGALPWRNKYSWCPSQDNTTDCYWPWAKQFTKEVWATLISCPLLWRNFPNGVAKVVWRCRQCTDNAQWLEVSCSIGSLLMCRICGPERILGPGKPWLLEASRSIHLDNHM